MNNWFSSKTTKYFGNGCPQSDDPIFKIHRCTNPPVDRWWMLSGEPNDSGIEGHTVTDRCNVCWRGYQLQERDMWIRGYWIIWCSPVFSILNFEYTMYLSTSTFYLHSPYYTPSNETLLDMLHVSWTQKLPNPTDLVGSGLKK
jgi:hypothetical protein